jgi:hypothetical protein
VAHGDVARITGGALLDEGPDGPARAHPTSDLPELLPIRVANRRTLDTYLQQNADRGDD